MNTIKVLLEAGLLIRFERLLTTDSYLVMLRRGEDNRIALKIYDHSADILLKWHRLFSEKDSATNAFQEIIEEHERRVSYFISIGFPLESLAKETMKHYG